MERFELTAYMSKGIENIIAEAKKSCFKNAKELTFLSGFSRHAKTSAYIRKEYEKTGTRIPPFIIASITSQCNMHCVGCYARGLDSCSDKTPENQLSAEEWNDVFKQAEELGVSFILLAGGEPMIREDVIKCAAEHKKIIFPIFTNGTLFNEKYLNFFDKHRNLVPFISLDGNQEMTDKRRGEGAYAKSISMMQRLADKKILYGVSVTVTTKNSDYVTSVEAMKLLRERGCKVVIYTEYVPIDKDTASLAPNINERNIIAERIVALREKYEDITFISFPGDEELTGGCLAAGRGFLHINSQGGTEPCPFSPYSDTNILDVSLKDALDSPLFKKLQNGSALKIKHNGGCALFENEEMVKKLVNTTDSE